jgi:hypothetical protein
MSVDVVVNALNVRFGTATPQTDGPTGQTFVIDGYIYPEGTLDQFGAESGILPDGSPEFPNLVIGRWVCRGWLYAPSAITSHYFVFNDYGDRLSIDGFEPFTANPIMRPIIGGTGNLRNARGQVAQQIIGFNVTEVPNFTFNFSFRQGIDFKQ